MTISQSLMRCVAKVTSCAVLIYIGFACHIVEAQNESSIGRCGRSMSEEAGDFEKDCRSIIASRSSSPQQKLDAYSWLCAISKAGDYEKFCEATKDLNEEEFEVANAIRAYNEGDKQQALYTFKSIQNRNPTPSNIGRYAYALKSVDPLTAFTLINRAIAGEPNNRFLERLKARITISMGAYADSADIIEDLKRSGNANSSDLEDLCFANLAMQRQEDSRYQANNCLLAFNKSGGKYIPLLMFRMLHDGDTSAMSMMLEQNKTISALHHDDKDALYAALIYDLRQSTRSESPRYLLNVNQKMLNLEQWPGPIIKYFQGKIGYLDLGELVKLDDKDNGKLCEATFYIGFAAKSGHFPPDGFDKATGQKMIAEAFKKCPKNYNEYAYLRSLYGARGP